MTMFGVEFQFKHYYKGYIGSCLMCAYKLSTKRDCFHYFTHDGQRKQLHIVTSKLFLIIFLNLSKYYKVYSKPYC